MQLRPRRPDQIQGFLFRERRPQQRAPIFTGVGQAARVPAEQNIEPHNAPGRVDACCGDPCFPAAGRNHERAPNRLAKVIGLV